MSTTAAVADAERLLTAGSFAQAAASALQLLKRPNSPPATPLAERCHAILCQAALHQRDPSLLEAAVDLAGGPHSLPCRTLLLLSLANIRLDRTDTVVRHVTAYLAHPAVAATLPEPDRVAVHRLMSLELYCKARRDFAAAYAWLHRAHSELPPERLEPLLAAIDRLQREAATATVSRGSLPPTSGAPLAAAAASPLQASQFLTMTGAGLADGSSPRVVRSPLLPAVAPASRLRLLQRPAGALQMMWVRLRAAGRWGAGVGWAGARWAEALVAAAVLYALVSEWKWVRAVLGSLTRRVGQGGAALRGAVWDALRMALALSPNPASQLPVGVRS